MLNSLLGRYIRISENLGYRNVYFNLIIKIKADIFSINQNINIFTNKKMRKRNDSGLELISSYLFTFLNN